MKRIIAFTLLMRWCATQVRRRRQPSGVIVGWGREVIGVDLRQGFVAVAAGYEHSLGLKADGSIVAWDTTAEANAMCLRRTQTSWRLRGAGFTASG